MFSLALGVTYFVYFLYKAFKGGVMETPFKILGLAMAFLTISQTSVLVEFFLNNSSLLLLQQAGEVIFLVFGLLGFYKLYAFWRFDFIGQIRQLEITPTAAPQAVKVVEE
jgi:hypothetical protein